MEMKSDFFEDYPEKQKCGLDEVKAPRMDSFGAKMPFGARLIKVERTEPQDENSSEFDCVMDDSIRTIDDDET